MFVRAWKVLKAAVAGYGRHRAAQMAAAIAFYTIFSLAPTLLIVVAVAEKVFRQSEKVRARLLSEFEALVGPEGAAQVQALMERVSPNWQGVWPTVVGGATMLLGATAVFSQIRNSLNVVWETPPLPNVTWRTLWRYLKTRLLSLAMVLSIAFVLLVSLVISTALNAVSAYLNGLMTLPFDFVQSANLLASLVVITSLFAAMFKVLPDRPIAWRDVWFGAIVTALLFTAGKSLVGMYLGRTSAASVYGAAGSLIIILLWVYYSALIFLFGAELTAANARLFGSLRPDAADAAPPATTPTPG